MGFIHLTQEEREKIKELYSRGLQIKDIAQELGRAKSTIHLQIIRHRDVYKRPDNFKKQHRLHSKEIRCYIKECILELKLQERECILKSKLQEKIYKKFNVFLDSDVIRYYVERYVFDKKYTKPKYSFLKNPVGTEIINSDGYIDIIVAPGKSRLKHHVIWEKEHPPIKPDEVLIFLDGDRQNVNIENLFLAKRNIIVYLNTVVSKLGRQITPAERKTLIIAATLLIEANKLERTKIKLLEKL